MPATNCRALFTTKGQGQGTKSRERGLTADRRLIPKALVPFGDRILRAARRGPGGRGETAFKLPWVLGEQGTSYITSMRKSGLGQGKGSGPGVGLEDRSWVWCFPS